MTSDKKFQCFYYEIEKEDEEQYVKIVGLDELADEPISSPIIPAYIENLPVKAIEDCAFNYAKITSIQMPETLVKIGHYAFFCCHQLEKISFPDSVSFIGSDVCGICENLQSVKWSSSAFTIPKNAFCSCHSLKTVSNIEHVKTIDSNAFRKTGLKFFKIPKSVLKISGCSFAECNDLKLIKMTHLPYIDKKAFMDSDNVKIMCGANHYVAEWTKLCNIPIYENKLDEFLDSVVCDKKKEGER